VSRNSKDWADKLIDALWAYKTVFKTPLGMSPFRVVFDKPCHALVELEHRAIWAIRTLNLHLEIVGVERKLQLSELEEIRAEAHENSRMHKGRAKLFMTSIFAGKSSSHIKSCCFMSPNYTFFQVS